MLEVFKNNFMLKKLYIYKIKIKKQPFFKSHNQTGSYIFKKYKKNYILIINYKNKLNQ